MSSGGITVIHLEFTVKSIFTHWITLHHVINFVFSLEKQSYKEAINCISHDIQVT